MKKKIFFAFAVLGMTAVLLIGCGKADPSECVHEFGAWAVEVEPGCETEGTQTHSCTECGYEEKETLPAKGHCEVVDPAVEATCAEYGKTEGSHCSACGEVLVEPRLRSKKQHSFKSEVLKEPTCTDLGLEKSVCLNCGYEEETVIGRLNHDFSEKIVVKEATCSEFGEESYVCTVCGHKTMKTIAKLKHTYADKDGYQCTVCGEVDEERIPFLSTGTTPYVLYSAESTLEITQITYSVSGSTLYIFLRGSKIADLYGERHDASCWIDWKLYDNNGYVADSGSALTEALRVGDKFEEKITVYDISLWKKYSFRII